MSKILKFQKKSFTRDKLLECTNSEEIKALIKGADEDSLSLVFEQVQVDLTKFADNLERAEQEVNAYMAGMVNKYGSMLPILALINYISVLSQKIEQMPKKDKNIDSLRTIIFNTEYQRVFEKSILSSYIGSEMKENDIENQKKDYTLTTWNLAVMFTYLEGRVVRQSNIIKRAKNELKEFYIRKEWGKGPVVNRFYFSRNDIWEQVKVKYSKILDDRNIKYFDQLMCYAEEYLEDNAWTMEIKQ